MSRLGILSCAILAAGAVLGLKAAIEMSLGTKDALRGERTTLEAQSEPSGGTATAERERAKKAAQGNAALLDENLLEAEDVPEGDPAFAGAPTRRVPLIEEVLLEDGEDPGAVLYMSRIREALHEGNPDFAQELLRKMREAHGHSILLGEAERLFERDGGQR